MRDKNAITPHGYYFPRGDTSARDASPLFFNIADESCLILSFPFNLDISLDKYPFFVFFFGRRIIGLIYPKDVSLFNPFIPLSEC